MNNIFEVVCSEKYLDVGLCTETIPDSNKPKTVRAQYNGFNAYYGGVDLMNWVHTGIYLTDREWNNISRGKTTDEILKALNIAKNCTKKSKRDLAINIIELFEDYLDRKGIVIPNEEKTDDECASNIYGSEYYELEDAIVDILTEPSN